MRLRSPCLAVSLALLAGCASDRDVPIVPACRAQTMTGTELALGGDLDSCRAAVARWFDGADADHDGSLSRSESERQVRIQFAALDTDHDGAITPAEADAAVPRHATHGDKGPPAMEPGGPPPLEGGRPMGRRRGGRGAGGAGGVTAAGGMAVASPIMAADADANFRVTPEELLAQAAKTFDRLDRDHDGTVSRDEAMAGLAMVVPRREGDGRRGRLRGGP